MEINVYHVYINKTLFRKTSEELDGVLPLLLVHIIEIISEGPRVKLFCMPEPILELF